MIIVVHLPVSYHSLLSAIPSHLLKKGFCGEVEIAIGLDIALSDAFVLRAYCLSAFAVFQVLQIAALHAP